MLHKEVVYTVLVTRFKLNNLKKEKKKSNIKSDNLKLNLQEGGKKRKRLFKIEVLFFFFKNGGFWALHRNLWCLHIEPTNTNGYTVDITTHLTVKIENHYESSVQRHLMYFHTKMFGCS